MIKTVLTVALLLAGTPAFAQEGSIRTASVRVAHTDLNLASSAGVAAFDRRIARAIGIVCPAPRSSELRHLMAVTKCRADARNGVVAQRTAALAAAETMRTPRIASAAR